MYTSAIFFYQTDNKKVLLILSRTHDVSAEPCALVSVARIKNKSFKIRTSGTQLQWCLQSTVVLLVTHLYARNSLELKHE